MEQKPIHQMSLSHQQLASDLFTIGAIKFGNFTLKLHDSHPDAPLSPIYLDLRVLQRFPDAKFAAVAVYQTLAKTLKFDLIAGIPVAAVSLASSLSDRMVIGQITPRISQKTHGSGAKIDGMQPEDKGKTVLLLDDMVTKGTSKFEAIDLLRSQGMVVNDVIVLIDREQGGVNELASKQCSLHSAFTLTQLLDFYVVTKKITEEKRKEIEDGIAIMEKYFADQSL